MSIDCDQGSFYLSLGNRYVESSKINTITALTLGWWLSTLFLTEPTQVEE